MKRRILLKISGEALMGDLPFGIALESTKVVAQKIGALQASGVEVGVVIGGGNLFRGIQQAESWGLERTPADQVGMLATLMNGVVLQRALISEGFDATLLSAIDCPLVAERYEWNRAIRHLAEGRIVIFVGGTGHPYFTTDTASALRACEIKADMLLKATMRVDGVYDKDPRTFADAKKYESLSFKEVLDRQLGVIDLSAVTLCLAAKIPIRVFNFHAAPLIDALGNKPLGTLIR